MTNQGGSMTGSREARVWSKWERGADGRFTRWRASSGLFPPLSMADQRDMYQTLNSAYLNALESQLEDCRALVRDAYNMVEAYEPAGTSSNRKQIESQRREQQEWLERADALAAPSSDTGSKEAEE